MLEYARLTPGPRFRPARAAFYYAHRLAISPWLRRAVAGGVARTVNVLHPRAPAPVTEGAFSEADGLRALKTQGHVALGSVLSDRQLSDIRAFLCDKDLVDQDRSAAPFRLDARPDGTRMAAYRLTDVLDCPHVVELANEPSILRLISGYFGCKPTISSWGLRWSFPSGTSGTSTQSFHRDTDDWRTVKLFVYLTDVDEGSGPHVFVEGSHLTRGTIFQRAVHEKQFSGAAVAKILGPSGFGFLADTYGYHKGAVPRDRPRLILQVQYSLLPVFAFLYPPPTRAHSNLDRYTNRLFFM